jgi:ArsR family transcriptional regulator
MFSVIGPFFLSRVRVMTVEGMGTAIKHTLADRCVKTDQVVHSQGGSRRRHIAPAAAKLRDKTPTRETASRLPLAQETDAGYFGLRRLAKDSPMPSKAQVTTHSAPSARPEPASHEHIARLAKALAHPARVRIVETLLRRKTCIGCDIVEEIGLAASTTSEHLRILKEAGIIIGEIERPRVCYSLEPAAVAPLLAFLEAVQAGPVPVLPE